MFPAIILVRVLFTTCMVFVIGYVFGGFSRRKNLALISKIATVLSIVLFIAANGILIRYGGRFHGFHNRSNHCYNQLQDSTTVK